MTEYGEIIKIEPLVAPQGICHACQFGYYGNDLRCQWCGYGRSSNADDRKIKEAKDRMQKWREECGESA